MRRSRDCAERCSERRSRGDGAADPAGGEQDEQLCSVLASCSAARAARGSRALAHAPCSSRELEQRPCTEQSGAACSCGCVRASRPAARMHAGCSSSGAEAAGSEEELHGMLAGWSGAPSSGALVQGWVLLHRAGAAAEQERAARSAHRVLPGKPAGRVVRDGEGATARARRSRCWREEAQGSSFPEPGRSPPSYLDSSVKPEGEGGRPSALSRGGGCSPRRIWTPPSSPRGRAGGPLLSPEAAAAPPVGVTLGHCGRHRAVKVGEAAEGQP
jgi:hypothetical protein